MRHCLFPPRLAASSRLLRHCGRPLHRAVALYATVLCAAAICCQSGALADVRSPPFEVELEAVGLILELVLADVEIVVRPGAPISLRFLATDSGPAVPKVELRREGAGWWVGRAADDPAPATELRLQATLPDGRGLRLHGEGLRLSLSRQQVEPQTSTAEDEEEQAKKNAAEEEPSAAEVLFVAVAPGPPRLPLELDLFGSVASLTNLNEVDLQAEESDVVATGGRGKLDAALISSTLAISETRAEIALQAQGSDITVVSSRGELRIELRGSSLVAEHQGRIQGQVEDSFVRLSEGLGRVELRGSGSTVEMRQAKYGQVRLQGTDLVVHGDDLTASLDVSLVGGSLTLTGCTGAAKVVGQGGLEFQLEGWQGGVELGLSEDSSAHLQGIRGLIKAQLEDAFFELSDSNELDLSALRSQVSVSDLRRLRRLVATDSQLELDLTGLRHNPTLVLQGASEAKVELDYPCAVRLAGGDETFDGRLRASGCGLDNAAHGRSRFDRFGLDGQRTVRMSVALSSESSLKIESSQ